MNNRSRLFLPIVFFFAMTLFQETSFSGSSGFSLLTSSRTSIPLRRRSHTCLVIRLVESPVRRA